MDEPPSSSMETRDLVAPKARFTAGMCGCMPLCHSIKSSITSVKDPEYLHAIYTRTVMPGGSHTNFWRLECPQA